MSKRLSELQKNLKVPKAQYNKFGGYNYRSCEDIKEAVKLMLKEDETLTTSYKVVDVAGSLFVEATVTICLDEKQFISTGYAMHALEKKGMDSAQITGAASSYAEKYALNGLFCLDDTKDADTNEHKQQQETKTQSILPKIEQQIKQADSLDVLSYVWKGFQEDLKTLSDADREKATQAKDKRKAEVVANV